MADAGISIAGRKIGPGEPVYIVAEISCNHMGDIGNANALIQAAKDAGADAVKFQAYEAWEIADPDETERLASGPWAGLTLYELYKQAETPRSWWPWLFEYGRQADIPVFASVFSPQGVVYLETLGCPAYKIASAERDWTELWDAVNDTDKPIIGSNGMHGGLMGGDITSAHIVLHCPPEYPANLSSIAFNSMPWTNDYRWGLSDHSMSYVPAQMAVALGACVIEHHLMLAGTDPLDKLHSWTPAQFADYVTAIRLAETIMGDGTTPEPDRTFLRRQLPDGRWLRSLAHAHQTT